MSDDTSDLVVFTDDPAAVAALPHAAPWRILIVDDDEDVHHATEFALAGIIILDRPVSFLHAYSALDAIDLLMQEQDVAVILLDVVMESESAGLSAVTTIRRDLGLTNTQIILRTGQPGYAPEIETIRRYEINDYRTKSELSRVKLYTAITAAVRAYQQLCRIDADRNALELVVDTGNRLINCADHAAFAEAVLERAAVLLDLPGRGMLVSPTTAGDHALAAVAGGCDAHPGDPLDAVIGICPQGVEMVREALAKTHTLLDARGAALYIPSARGQAMVAYLQGGTRMPAVSRQMLDVFCTTVSVCSENVQLVARLSHMAFTDQLTGLASRRAFAVELDRRLDTLPRADTAIVLLDVDQFAEINDMFGHVYGDKLLCAIGARLREGLPADVLIGRLGADTFALLGLPEQFARTPWRELLERPFLIDGEERAATVSSALVVADDVEGSALDIIKDATIVIKRVKLRGIGRHGTYSPDLSAQTRDRSRLLHDLGLVFRRNGLFLEYQPQLALADGEVRGVEALLRWRQDDGIFIPPDQFIPLAEHSGLIVPIGYWVIETALAALVALRAAGHPDIRMAVNVSPQQFKQPEFVERLCSAVERAAIPPGQFEIEVTEGVSILGLADAFAQIEAIRARGIAVAIDDFGTGYSSLSYLDQLRADRIKIDRMFVRTLDAQSPQLAQTIVELGRQMRMSTLAEGVETQAQADALRALGCDEVQGFHFARPMPFDALTGWLDARA